MNINQFPRVYFYFGKNAFSVFAFLGIGRKLVSQQIGVMHFSCVASAAHFFIVTGGGNVFLSDLWNAYLFENRNGNARIMQDAVRKTDASLDKLISTLNTEQRALLAEYEENVNELSGFSSENCKRSCS